MMLPSNAIGNLVIGAAVAVIGPKVLRPLVVGVVRAGIEVKDYASSAWSKAKSEAGRVRDEANFRKDSSAELQQLRDELSVLKATQANKSA
jgi:Sec-independent protein translocase protein TatA